MKALRDMSYDEYCDMLDDMDFQELSAYRKKLLSNNVPQDYIKVLNINQKRRIKWINP